MKLKILFIQMSLGLKKNKEKLKAFLQQFIKVRLAKMRTLL